MIAKIKTKMKFLPTVEWGQVLNVPTIVESPVSFELEVKKAIPMGDGSDIFLCLIRNVTQDEKLPDMEVPFTERLMKAAPVFAPGEDTYSTIDGRYHGKWGEPMKNVANIKEQLYNTNAFWKNRLQRSWNDLIPPNWGD